MELVDDEYHIIQDDGQMWVNENGRWVNRRVCDEALDALMTLMLG